MARCSAPLTPASQTKRKHQPYVCKDVQESILTNAVRKPSHFRYEPSARLQHFPGTHQNSHRIRFTPVHRRVAKHRVKFFLDTHGIAWKLQRLDI